MEYAERYFTSADGLRLYFREYGSGGPAVLCLPGLTRNSKDFHEVALHLAPRFRVVCPDLRGRGQSDRDPNWRNYNPATYVNDVKQLTEEAGIVSATFLGTSLGGLISIYMAYREPERIQSIILNDIGPEIDPAGLARIIGYVGKTAPVGSWSEAAARTRATYGIALPDRPDHFWDDYCRRSYREGPAGAPVLDMDPKIGDAARAGTKAGRWLSVLRSLRLMREVRGLPIDVWEAFGAVTMPCLVLRGALSDILSEDIVDRMQAVKPDLRRATIPGVGHPPLLDEPESTDAIDTFLSGL